LLVKGIFVTFHKQTHLFAWPFGQHQLTSGYDFEPTFPVYPCSIGLFAPVLGFDFKFAYFSPLLTSGDVRRQVRCPSTFRATPSYVLL
jgi:hypothetical protein